MAIDPKLPIPVYFQLKTLLLEEILEGRYGLDGRLPTEHQLCGQHQISRTPVTRALSELATEDDFGHVGIAEAVIAARDDQGTRAGQDVVGRRGNVGHGGLTTFQLVGSQERDAPTIREW